MNTLEPVLLCLFSPYLMFFIIDNQRRNTKFDDYLAVHDELFFRIYRSAWIVLYMKTFFFPLIDRLVCTMQ
mgnify:CR=1 FL=1